MKRLFIAAVMLLVSSVAALAQNAPDTDVLTKMLNEFLAGASNNDPAAHEKFWADDLIYTRSTGVRTNKAEIMNGFKTTRPAPKAGDPVTVYSAEDIVIHQYGAKKEMAIVAFRLMITTTNKDGTKVGNNLNTGVFLKQKGNWQVVAWQSTVVPDSKTEAKTTSASVEGYTDKTPKAEGPHTYLKGGRGGCYYLKPSGGKVYVDHKYCSQ